MCNSCVQPVQSLVKSSGREYILYAGLDGQKVGTGETSRLSTFSTHRITPSLSTYFPGHINLLVRMLSTLYTGPINTTTTYINI